jgi:F420-0:gamma-glutamyl ligase
MGASTHPSSVQGWVRWRVESRPESIGEEAVAREMARGKAVVDGSDVDGRPCVVIRVAKHITGEVGDVT